MVEPMLLNSWVCVSGNCAMTGSVHGTDEVFFTFGTGGSTFEFAFDAEGLRRFVALANEGLRELDERTAREQTGVPDPDHRTRLASPSPTRR